MSSGLFDDASNNYRVNFYSEYRSGGFMIVKELRFGVLGWGYWGPKIARNLDTLPHSTIAMVADQDARRLASLATNQPWTQTTTQAEDVFRADVDGVVIATPVRTHYKLARQALLHG